MSKKWKNRQLRVAAALVFLVGPAMGMASAQTPNPPAQIVNITDSKDIKASPAAAPADDEARLKQFLDKNGGYKDKTGAYFDPKAGTFTDKDGGVVDNWKGYTYKDGSYKSQYGDYYDAPKLTMHLASGDVVKVPAGTKSSDVINVLRANVEKTGGYDKDYVRKQMMIQVGIEHPASPPPATPKP